MMINLEDYHPKTSELADVLEQEPGFILKRAMLPNSLENIKGWFLSVCQKLGTPLSQNTDGDLVLSVKNEALAANDPKVRGPNTNKKLSFHTDRSDVIAFLCLQPAKSGGENQIVQSGKIEKVIKKERPDLHAILCQKFPYKTHTIDSANSLPFCEQPIFSWRDDFFACSYLRVLINRADQDPDCPNLSDVQKEALDFLDSVCERKELQTRLTLQRADILFLNNWTTLHRRTAFKDYEEPKNKRHLLRIWLSMPNSRPLNEAFRANFGSVEAGSLRGGIRSLA
jgi:hypothetical protein